MASYRSLKQKHSFHDLCCTADLAAQVTLQPVEAFDVDAAILFSDILLPLCVFGASTEFRESGGPLVTAPSIDQITAPLDISSALQEQLPGVYQAISLLTRSIDRPLIGFSGAPWTLAAYLIEKGSSPSWPAACSAIVHQPQLLLRLVRALEDLAVAHLTLQIRAGVKAVQLFDSLSHLLPSSHFEALSCQPILRIIKRLPPCPVIIYKATHQNAPLYLSSGAAGLSCDETVDLATSRTLIPQPIAIQGTLSPQLLLGPSDHLVEEIRRICSCMNSDRGFIFNLSGGVPPQTAENTVRLLVETVREFRGP